MVEATNTVNATKCCSRCDATKPFADFIKNRNICRVCSNTRQLELRNLPDTNETRTCRVCSEEKATALFMKKRNLCIDCSNKSRREKYESDDLFRAKVIKERFKYKHNKVLERRAEKLQRIGANNKQCSCCSQIKPMEKFRYNRLKCRDCERDDPVDRLKRNIRSRIHSALNKKELHTAEYLGMNSIEYFKWLLTCDERYDLENRKEWHIDHVIPVSKFNLDNKEEQLIAFNWRNTMPLLVRDNLAKNNKIDTAQIEQHYSRLLEYHKTNNIEFPKVFIDLFAKYLVAGIPLEPKLPLIPGNLNEDLG